MLLSSSSLMDDKDFKGAFNLATAIFMQFNFFEERQKEKLEPKTFSPEALVVQNYTQNVIGLLDKILGAHQQYDDDLQLDVFQSSMTSAEDQLFGLIETGKIICEMNVKEAAPCLTSKELPRIIDHLKCLKLKLIESVEAKDDNESTVNNLKISTSKWLIQKFHKLLIRSKLNEKEILTEQLNEEAIVFPIGHGKDMKASNSSDNLKKDEFEFSPSIISTKPF